MAEGGRPAQAKKQRAAFFSEGGSSTIEGGTLILPIRPASRSTDFLWYLVSHASDIFVDKRDEIVTQRTPITFGASLCFFKQVFRTTECGIFTTHEIEVR